MSTSSFLVTQVNLQRPGGWSDVSPAECLLHVLPEACVFQWDHKKNLGSHAYIYLRIFIASVLTCNERISWKLEEKCSFLSEVFSPGFSFSET